MTGLRLPVSRVAHRRASRHSALFQPVVMLVFQPVVMLV